MRKIFTLLSCLFFSCAFAEMIENVEYHLPKVAQDWVVGNKLEGKTGTTILYIPAGIERQHSKEFFGVSSVNRPTDINEDASAIKQGLVKLFPGMDLEIPHYEKSQDGFIYEWFAKQDGSEKIHGWARIFSNKEDTIILGYQTENIADVAQARSIWLPTLKEAHIK